MASRGPSPPPPPPIHAYWFYSSPFPLDDPLAPFPIPTAATAAIKHLPRPFARYDSLALEAAYQDLLVTQRAREVEYERSQAVSTPAASFFRGRTPKIIRRESDKSATSTTSARTIKEVAKEGVFVLKGEGDAEVAVGVTGVVIPDGPVRKSSASTLRFSSSTSSSLSIGLGKSPGTGLGISPNVGLGKSPGMGLGISPNVGLGTPPNLGRGTSPGVGLGTSPTLRLGTSPSLAFGTSPNLGLGTSPNTSGTTRTPFIRSLTQSRASTMPPPSHSLSPSRRSSVKKPTPPPSPPIQIEIPVGIQRLHQVLLPSFLMTPIYWSPLQDIASVMRGTWFYGETMLPVDAEAANRLEAGWEEVRAWTEEWEMELASAVEVGREGEEKVRWQLWMKETAGSRPGSALGESSGEGMGGFDSESAKIGATGNTDASRAGGARADAADWVLFANGTDAYICRDSMLSFGNKRPLANIRRGRLVGTHVVRGFQQEVWERLNPSVKKRKVPASGSSATGRKWSMSSTTDSREKKGHGPSRRPVSSSPAPATTSSGSVREEMEGLGPDDEDRIPVTDLFLVIHGIGQKLSERVESFHFTHAINSFRRHINVELKDPAVRPHLRDGGKVGMMVLPVNWRHNLSFEDGLPNSSSTPPDFTLADITPPSIPAVRNLIGDVMLDIPYYLSHHKQKMICAVVKEANRVWRLWCANNPGFEKVGRVHIIAHSLGTAIAMDILSLQPTSLDREWEGLTVGKGGKGGTGWGRAGGKNTGAEDQFDFDTKSVFFVGSPAGFFLLLNKSGFLHQR